MQYPRFHLIDAENTYNPALTILKARGYAVGVYPAESDEPESDDEEPCIGYWWARMEDREFVGDDPLALLGLVSIYEQRCEDWQQEGDIQTYLDALGECGGED